MRKTVLSIALTALLGLTAGACSDDKKDPSAKPEPTTAGGPVAATVNATGTTWEPDETVIKAGETVEWDVKGSIVHDIKGDEGLSHKAASTFKYRKTFEKAGTFSYQCTIHPGMTGTITVNP